MDMKEKMFRVLQVIIFAIFFVFCAFALYWAIIPSQWAQDTVEEKTQSPESRVITPQNCTGRLSQADGCQ